MARIRSIKPEFPGDEKLAMVTRDARLTFILAMTQADDEGLLSAAPRQLLGSLYPLDESVTPPLLEAWIGELIAIARVRWRFTTDGARVLEFVNWKKHQKIDKPSPSKIKPLLTPLAESSRTPRELPASGQRIEREVDVDVDHGERSGKNLCETKGESTKPCGELPHGSPANDPPLSDAKGDDHNSPTQRGIRDFLGHFYAAAPIRRKYDVAGQLNAVLTSVGCPFEGERVRAVDGRHLREVMLETIAEQAKPKTKLRDRDKAIVVVLLKLRKTFTETQSARHKEPPRSRPIDAESRKPVPISDVLARMGA